MEEMRKDFPSCDFSFIPKGVTVNYIRFNDIGAFSDFVFSRARNNGLEESMFIPFGMERVSIKSESNKILGKNVLVFFTKSSDPKVYDFVGVI